MVNLVAVTRVLRATTKNGLQLSGENPGYAYAVPRAGL